MSQTCEILQAPATLTLTALESPTQLQISQLQQATRRLSGLLQSTKYHLHTIWLFNRSDVKTVIVPQMTAGMLGALSGLMTSDENHHVSLSTVLSRLPFTLVWLYMTLLVESISNQRLPASIVEDRGNKPWRPLPARRISPDQARQLSLCILPLAVLLGYTFGIVQETLIFFMAVYCYNDLGGADTGYVARNFLNAVGISTLNIGTTVGVAGAAQLNKSGYGWIALMGFAVLLTIQMADLPDVVGDRLKGRRTLPLVFGDKVTRWSIAVPVAAFSLACPTYWNMGLLGYILAGSVGGVLSLRVLSLRTVKADKGSWKLWCVWMICLYSLPLVKSLGG